MKKNNYKYIYGPVSSWRLGSSLGIDPISAAKKTCTFDCVYCQLGKGAVFTNKREIFVPAGEIIKEIKALPHLGIDYITISGRGEPTLARNLGGIIKEIKAARKEKVAVITNSSLIDQEDVREDLALADLVMLKLDASSRDLFFRINRPMKGVRFENILNGIKDFKPMYRKKLAVQIMFTEENKNFAGGIAGLVREINPDEVQLNTPLRPCGAKPLSKEEMAAIKDYFKGMNAISVYDKDKKVVKPVSSADTLRRRGKEKISRER